MGQHPRAFEDPWHGSWQRLPDNTLRVEFDYKGRNLRKWTILHLNIESAGGEGEAYRGRLIQVVHGGGWQFDSDTATYAVCDQ